MSIIKEFKIVIKLRRDSEKAFLEKDLRLSESYRLQAEDCEWCLQKVNQAKKELKKRLCLSNHFCETNKYKGKLFVCRNCQHLDEVFR